MALQKSVTTPHGFSASNAYHRVENITIHAKNSMSFQVKSYKDANSIPFETVMFECAYDIASGNPYIQAYLFLKTLDQFKTAVDC